VLSWAVLTSARYVGMSGSRRKVITIYRELEKEGVSPEKFANVHAPVGLDIGAITPEEIAVAVVGEMIAVRRHSASVLPHLRYLGDLARQPQTTESDTVATSINFEE